MLTLRALLASPRPFLTSAKLLLSCCPRIFQGLTTLCPLLLEVMQMTPGQRQLTVVVAVDAWMVELRQQTCYCVCLSNIPFPGRKETKAQAAGEPALVLPLPLPQAIVRKRESSVTEWTRVAYRPAEYQRKCLKMEAGSLMMAALKREKEEERRQREAAPP